MCYVMTSDPLAQLYLPIPQRMFSLSVESVWQINTVLGEGGDLLITIHSLLSLSVTANRNIITRVSVL